MDMNNLSTFNTFINFKMNNVIVTVPLNPPVFATIFNDYLKEKSFAQTNPNDLKSSLELHLQENKVNQTVEVENNYCSLCGSMIEDDGSCPLCIVPIFISGSSNHTIQNHIVSQANNFHLNFGGRKTPFFRK